MPAWMMKAHVNVMPRFSQMNFSKESAAPKYEQSEAISCSSGVKLNSLPKVMISGRQPAMTMPNQRIEQILFMFPLDVKSQRA